ncbi:MAG TPA: type II toxin-antitoxin system VapC family toxin [Syntrophales bacterium]|jgi:ribonuclease VapC|nr:type II toxin-antitoxin system VapC family toxin [Syntrophales bacterium]HON23324.1 type II toxin-antitoxin system VapC family toxin [Syntrophales bacterium]HPC33771.1 type II toxin-antitoxin system VapC family toxin [Syntrophales bacterium]HRR47532.1 type II toxin-antitoxin system VapC family toxin [Syntrophales bacterium]HRU88847.1 type II toxin-antitoxin system VapC family toxin [Syntrophales bacterium]
MKMKRALDSFALLAFLNGEAGCDRVRELLAEAQETACDMLMNEINVGETYYILSRKRSPEKAKYFLEIILPGLPIYCVPNDFDQVIAAARLKAEYPLSYADCFAVETARREGATILTGDREFKSVEHLVSIEWL